MELKEKISDIINENKGDVGVVVKNLNTDSTIMINEEEVFPSASTIKLVIISTLMKEVSKGIMKLDDKIVLTNKCKCGGDGILKELNDGKSFTLKEIATLMIILSDNTATNILIDLLSMEKINEMAKELNLPNTQLRRKMMDSEAARMGRENVTTAKDMCHILELIYKGKVVSEEYSDIILDILKRQQVGGRLNLYLPEEITIAHKTGDLDKLEHDVGIVYHQHCNYIICVLTKNVETNKDGREIIGKVSLQVYNNVEQI
ncbi:serine hydrolase [Clostridium lundense]|uniref:serine hydrolase n=1 Tax=Clostridium lundense TaxID=319475 RepID=UPI000481B14F|nr:serine hydrolase [Clostridium lundense]